MEGDKGAVRSSACSKLAQKIPKMALSIQESAHRLNRFMRQRGIKLCNESDEALRRVQEVYKELRSVKSSLSRLWNVSHFFDQDTYTKDRLEMEARVVVKNIEFLEQKEVCVKKRLDELIRDAKKADRVDNYSSAVDLELKLSSEESYKAKGAVDVKSAAKYQENNGSSKTDSRNEKVLDFDRRLSMRRRVASVGDVQDSRTENFEISKTADDDDQEGTISKTSNGRRNLDQTEDKPSNGRRNLDQTEDGTDFNGDLGLFGDSLHIVRIAAEIDTAWSAEDIQATRILDNDKHVQVPAESERPNPPKKLQIRRRHMRS